MSFQIIGMIALLGVVSVLGPDSCIDPYLGPEAADTVPEIVGVTGRPAEGEVLVLRGSGFGKSATVLSWDDFEGHAEGDLVEGLTPPVGPAWRHFQGTVPSDISAYRSVSGTRAARVCWNDGNGNGSPGSNIGFSIDRLFRSFYISFHRYLAGSGNAVDDGVLRGWDHGSANHKVLYVKGNTWIDGRPQMVLGATIDGSVWRLGTNGKLSLPDGSEGWHMPQNGGDQYLHPDDTLDWDSTIDVWQRWELFCELNPPSTEANDKVQFFHDQRLMFESDEKHLTDGGLYKDIRLGNMDNSYDVFDSLYAYFDDVYVANGRARVEVGDDPDLLSCTERHIHPYSAWSDSTISFRLRVSPDDRPLYVFVIGEDGAWDSAPLPTRSEGRTERLRKH